MDGRFASKIQIHVAHWDVFQKGSNFIWEATNPVIGFFGLIISKVVTDAFSFGPFGSIFYALSYHILCKCNNIWSPQYFCYQ